MEINPETVYGGSNSSNRVAEIDGHNNSSSTSDDRVLCQAIDCFVIGHDYTLNFRAARRSSSNAPNPVEINVEIDGGALIQTVRELGHSSG